MRKYKPPIGDAAPPGLRCMLWFHPLYHPMRLSLLIGLLLVTLLSGCATPLSERAAGLRVLPQDSSVLRQCVTLGSVAGRSSRLRLESAAESKAMADLLDTAAGMDANAVTLVNTTVADEVVTLYGLALKCP